MKKKGDIGKEDRKKAPNSSGGEDDMTLEGKASITFPKKGGEEKRRRSHFISRERPSIGPEHLLVKGEATDSSRKVKEKEGGAIKREENKHWGRHPPYHSI